MIKTEAETREKLRELKKQFGFLSSQVPEAQVVYDRMFTLGCIEICEWALGEEQK